MSIRITQVTLFVALLAGLTSCIPAVKTIVRKPEKDDYRFYGLQAVKGVAGAEDLTLADSSGLVFVSADDRRATMRDTPVQGGIYLYDLRRPLMPPVLLTRDFKPSLHPHGISYYPPDKPNGAGTLFVVNHRIENGKQRNTVEIFDWLEGKLTHRMTVEDKLMLHPNDVCGVGPNQFYFTNDHGSKSKFGFYLETLFRLPRAGVVYCDAIKQTFTPALGHLVYANGVNRSKEGKYIYVSTVARGRVLRCTTTATGVLSIQNEVLLRSGADNIEVDDSGKLWVTCHSNLLKFVSHVYNPKAISPWEVYRVDFDAKLPNVRVRRYYENAGLDLSGASVTLVWHNQFVTGSVFEPRILTGKYH
jgi:arylesterase / paraoxonase